MTKSEHAKEYRSQGYTYAAIAQAMGVSSTWAYALVNDEARARLNERANAYILGAGTCPDCGGPMTKPSHAISNGRPHEHARCRACWAKKRRADSLAEYVRDETCACRTCHAFKPFAAFPQGVLSRYLGGKGNRPECRECGSANRRDYRERRKRPCANCGAPRLDEPSWKGPLTGLCRPCFVESRRAVA